MTTHKRLSITSAMLLLTASLNTSADIIDHGSYLTDTATGLDWLDVTETVNMSINNVIMESGAGGRFSGWRYATGAEVNDLVSDFTGIQITNYGTVSLPSGSTDRLVDLLGSTRESWSNLNPQSYQMYCTNCSDAEYTFGYVADHISDYFYTALVWDSTLPGSADWVSSHYSVNNAYWGFYDVGSYLVRGHIPAVPEPETYIMMMAGLSIVGAVARRKEKQAA